MRWSHLLAVIVGPVLVACGNGSSPDAGNTPTDTGTGGGNDVVMADGLSCADYAHACAGQTQPYGLCCPTCPTGFTCGYANPGVDAGNATTVLMCSKTCQNGADCPAVGTTQALCVLGLCYEQCDPTAATGCPPSEQCITVFGHSVCAAVSCN